MSLDSRIIAALEQTPPDRPVWVALSGGLDSGLLLFLAVRAARSRPRPIYALHVNHGLQTAAGDFERHCRRLCSRLGVPLFIEHAAVALPGKGLEAAAREARYRAFARRVRAGETLWLAQHADDQAETLLLAALRGSGVRGLAGMPVERTWQGCQLVRPLLGYTRSTLESEARLRAVPWIDDPSNRDTALDRNFLRRTIMPRLTQRWPSAASVLARSAELAGEADELLDDLAALDLAAAGGAPERIALATWRSLSLPRRRLMIRYACQRLGLPTPPASRLAVLLGQLDAARDDARVHVAWPGAEARRWRDTLYLLKPPTCTPSEGWQAEWQGRPGLVTPLGRIACHLERREGHTPTLQVTLRRGGESLRVAGRGRRDVKRLLQEAAIPPWQRAHQLLVWHGETLVAVLGVAIAEGWRQRGPTWGD